MIRVYVPNDDKSKTIKDEFYEKVTQIIEHQPKEKFLLLRVKNIRTGKFGNNTIIGKHGENIKNDSEQKLIDMCISLFIRIMNDFFPIGQYINQSDTNQYTKHKNLKSIIDCVLQ